MRVDEAEQRLRSALQAGGLNLARLDPGMTWDVFRTFAAERVDGTGDDPGDDMCLFEYGVYDWHDGKGRRFNWSVCRQFCIYVDGEYDHMEQLRCDLYFEPTSELEAVGVADLWSDDQLDDWIGNVEKMAGFRVALGREPVESRCAQEWV